MAILYILVGLLIGSACGYLFSAKKRQEEKLNDQILIKELQTRNEEQQKQHQQEVELRERRFQEQLRTSNEQFQNLATRIMEQTTSKLKEQNSESIGHITQPLKENLERLQDAISKTNTATTQNTSSLVKQLELMAQKTDKIDQSATRLANVMRGANKVQGNWGELTLQNLLDSQGLQLGRDYDMQQTITDEKGNAILNDDSGKRMIPDVILHYPNGEDVVIDSKMTIDSYLSYVNAETDDMKKKYADDVVKSIRTQFNSLARKDYSAYIKSPRRAIDFVIMYVPYEGALQLALARDPKLWNEAFEKQVFITSQQNLMAILKIIQIAWRQFNQTENQKHVYDLAEELLKRVGDFVKRFDKVGKDIESLHKSYDDAYKKAYTGRQSIVQKANELKQLGVKENATLQIPQAEIDLED
ncbi:MAG: DNA recombination protein RmuC [Prevotella sp.]|jgi:DNA recombination protein RmuC|nr:DNA recombination protein RmuC [Prevotella sp.]